MEFSKYFEAALKEVLREKIDIKMKAYPSALRPSDIEEIMNCSKNASYPALRAGEIPGAKKISNLGWRVPKELFFVWWFGDKGTNKKIFKSVRREKINAKR